MPQEPMPECPFCNIGSTYVVPSEGGYHCNNCDGNFDSSGEWMAAYEEEEDGGNDDQYVREIYNPITGEYSSEYIGPPDQS